MDVEYKREANHNYMIKVQKNVETIRDYRIRMLLENKVDGLIPMHANYVDGNLYLSYDITSKQPLSSMLLCRTLTYENIHTFLIVLNNVLEQLQMLLIDIDTIQVKSEYIFVDPEKMTPFFCCNPCEKKDFYSEFQGFLQYILGNIDHNDKEAVVLAYGIQQESIKTNYSFKDIMKYLTNEKELESHENKIYRMDNIDIQKPKDMSSHIILEKNKVSKEIEANPPKLCYLKITVICLLVLILITILFYLTWILKIISGGIGTMLIGIGIVSIFPIGIKIKEYLEDNKRSKVIEVEEPIPYIKNNNNLHNGVKDRVEMEHIDGIDDETGEIMEEGNACHFYNKGNISKANEYGNTMLLSVADEVNRKLILLEGREQEEVTISKDIFLIGKLKSNVDLALIHPMVSRLHSRLLKKENGYYLEDMNSTNGTYINNIRIESGERKMISTGDKLTFGCVSYIFR